MEAMPFEPKTRVCRALCMAGDADMFLPSTAVVSLQGIMPRFVAVLDQLISRFVGKQEN